jgi:hypothetical protein
MKKRVLSLLLCFVLAAGLLSVCAPPAQAGTIADAFELFIKQPGQIKKLFGREVAHGDCGPAGDEASVHYKIYEVTNPTVVQDNPFLQQIWQIHDYREDAQYYGVYIFGDGKMADYAATGQKAPWMGNVTVTEYNDKGEKLGTTVVENLGEEYLALAYIADGTDEEWDGRTERYSGVTNVGAYAFKDCRYLTCMFLNDDITTISERAFYKDEYLSAINMPRKLELIDKYAFYGCDTLTFVRARNCSRLRRIEDHAFYSCTMLAELRLPEGLTYIGPWAFAWDRILGQEDTTLGLPSSLQTISTGAFAFVNHHKNLNIPANVTSIGDYAFMCDYYMNNLTFSPGDKKLTIGKAAFFGDNHMKSVDLSNRVAQIDRCAFAGCEMLEEAYFGDKIDTIEGRAFTSLDNAMKIAVEGVLNGILRPDDTEQNADQAGDISTALNMIAKVTKLKRAVFKNDPAKSIYAAADSNRSFPDDCVVYYPQGSYTWAAELKDDGTWQGYQTGFWHGDHIAAFTDTVVAPTCTEQGYTHHVCTVKGCTYAPVDDTYVAATDHTWVKTQTNPPTCTEKGTQFYKCSVCGATRTEKIAALGHDLSRCDLRPAATCTQPGRAVGTCARCGVQIDEVIPAKGHDYSYAETSVAPTCTEPGHYKGTCPTCGKDYDDVVPALGHDWGEWVTSIEPTVSTVGYRYHVCNRDGCGYREGEDIPKLHTHTWDDGVVTQKPTAAEPGVRTYTCTVCGQTRTEAIPATGVPETCNGGPACPGYAFRDMPAPSIWSHAGLDYCIDHGYIAGTSATTVTPDGECTRAMIVSILYRVQGEPAKVNGYELKKLAAPFDDVERGYWYTDAIWWAKLTGVVSGMSPSTFAPDDPITRAQLAVILYNYTKQFAPESLTETGSLTGFPDAGSVPSWARTAMAWAVGNGLISGVGENGVSYLRPEGCATRAQVATILMNYEKALG